nr:hypothetical protein [Tanacetum cinerariifolium]
MASDHISSDPAPECQRMALEHDSLSPGPQCQKNVTQADKTVTTLNELDLLFSPMFDELLNGSSKVVSKSSAVSTADAPNQRQQHTTPLNTQTTTSPTFENDEFINIFCTPVQDREETSSRHVDSSNMHTFYQHHPSEPRWTKDHPLEQVIRNPSQSVRTRPMADSTWIDSMQEELHQFDRLDVCELVDKPLCKNVINMKWLWKNKRDEENTRDFTNNVKNDLRNEMKNSIQASMSNQTNELKNMMASFFQMNIAFTLGSGSLPSNTVANLKGELKSITTRSGIFLDGPSVPTPPPFINLELDKRVEETLTDLDLVEYTIKVPPPLVQKSKPPSQRDFLCIKGIIFTQISPIFQRCSSKNSKKKMKSKSINFGKCSSSFISTSLLLMLWFLCSNTKKCLKLSFPTRRNFKNWQTHPLMKIAQRLSLRSTSINLMPLSVWKKLGLPELISTRMTLELANRAICTLAGIARDVIVDYESDPRVPLTLGRSFLWTARVLIDVHGEEMILRDDNIFNPKGGNVLPEKFLDLDSTKDLHPPLHVNPLSGSTTYSSFSNKLLEEFADELALITFPPKYDDLQFNIEPDLKEIEYLLHQYPIKDIDSILKDSIDQKIEYLLHQYPIKDIDSILKDSIDQSNLADLNDNLVDSMPEMFTDEHALDYSSPPIFNEYDDDHFEVESDTKNIYDDPFDSKGEKIKESMLKIKIRMFQVQTSGSGISILLIVATTFTSSGNLYCQWEL